MRGSGVAAEGALLRGWPWGRGQERAGRPGAGGVARLHGQPAHGVHGWEVGGEERKSRVEGEGGRARILGTYDQTR